jgi:hypothetical protein
MRPQRAGLALKANAGACVKQGDHNRGHIPTPGTGLPHYGKLGTVSESVPLKAILR